MTADYLGEFEHLVLLAVLRLGDDAYGVPIRRIIQERAERSVSFGAVYSTLRRLRAKGYVETHSTAASGDGHGGRPKQIFRVTDDGRQAVFASQRRLERMQNADCRLQIVDE